MVLIICNSGVFLDKDFEKQASERQRARWERDNDDLNREMSGVQGNRIKRFSGETTEFRSGTGKKDQATDDFTDFVLSDLQRIEQIRHEIDLLDRASLEALREAEERLEMIRRAANRATDGRRVYETEDGRYIYDKDGNEVARDKIDPAKWNSNGPTWERYVSDKREVKETKDFRTKLREQKARLEDDPSADELNDIEAELDALKRNMPAGVRAHHNRLAVQDPNPRTASAAASYAGRAGFEKAPRLDIAFSASAKGIAPPDAAPDPDSTAPAVPRGDHDFSR